MQNFYANNQTLNEYRHTNYQIEIFQKAPLERDKKHLKNFATFRLEKPILSANDCEKF